MSSQWCHLEIPTPAAGGPPTRHPGSLPSRRRPRHLNLDSSISSHNQQPKSYGSIPDPDDSAQQKKGCFTPRYNRATKKTPRTRKSFLSWRYTPPHVLLFCVKKKKNEKTENCVSRWYHFFVLPKQLATLAFDIWDQLTLTPLKKEKQTIKSHAKIKVNYRL